MVERTEYLKKLTLWKDEQVIKVVTGIRLVAAADSLIAISISCHIICCIFKDVSYV